MEEPTDVDLRVLDLLREDARGAGPLAQALSLRGEPVGVEEVRGSLGWLASRGLARPLTETQHHADGVDADEETLPDEEDDDRPWEITEEGRKVIESETRIVRAPRDRSVVGDEENGGPDAGLVVLLLIALVTGACAAYTLLTATGILGG